MAGPISATVTNVRDGQIPTDRDASDVDFYDTPGYAYAWSILLAKLSQRIGPLVVTGESGIGKTLLIQRVIKGLGEDVRAIPVYFPRLGVDDALHFLAATLGLAESEYQADTGPDERFDSLRDWLGRQRVAGRYVAVFVDDAQDAPYDLLIALLRLSQGSPEDGAALGLVLVGLPQLELRLVQPELHDLLNDHCFFCRLRPLRLGEIGAYLRKRLTAAGTWREELLTADAVATIGAYSHGVPRLINTLCDAALFIAQTSQLETITREVVEEATKVCSLSLSVSEDRFPGLDDRDTAPVSSVGGIPCRGELDDDATADASIAAHVPADGTEPTADRTDVSAPAGPKHPSEAEVADNADTVEQAVVPAQDGSDSRFAVSAPPPTVIEPRAGGTTAEPEDAPRAALPGPGSDATRTGSPTTRSLSRREKSMYRTESLNKVLKSIQTGSPDVEASALITEDGLMIASALPQDLDETRVAGMSATLLSLGTRAAAELGRGEVEEVVVRGEHGYAVMITAGRGVLLLVVANENAKLGLIFFDMREAINAIKRIL